jgi:hypothetical protein
MYREVVEEGENGRVSSVMILVLNDGGDVLPSPSFLLIWVTMESQEQQKTNLSECYKIS